MGRSGRGGLRRWGGWLLGTGGLVALVLAGFAGSGSAARAASAPSNTAPPTIDGRAQQGQTLTAQSGSWAGSTPIVFAFQWQRCDANGAGCGSISGASAQTYTLTGADVGSTLRVAVTASNSSGTSTADSALTAVVVAANAPVNTAVPTISGTAQQGQTLSVQNGSWSGSQPISYSYQWLRCDPGGGACATVGANSQTYPLGSADVGRTLRVIVTATNAAGAATAVSGPSGLVAAPGSAPANSSPPLVSGTLETGQSLTVSTGSWNGTTPLSFAYAWQRCDANGANCSFIGGLTASSYTLQASDVGHTFRAEVTATNSVGSGQAYSQLTGVVHGPPANTGLPTISGSAQQGQTLTASSGSWASVSPVTYYYQWARSNTHGGFDPIPGAQQRTYTLAAADVGHHLFVQVKAQNARGASFADSKPTTTIQASPTTPPPPPPHAGPLPVASVALPDRLVISDVSFQPSLLGSRAPFLARFRVTDSAHASPVSGALVYALGLPYAWLQNAPEAATGADGWATITLAPTSALPLHRGAALVLFVRARKPGENLLAGVSTRRLVQIRIG